MREVIIGAVSAFVVAVLTITFFGPTEPPPAPPAPVAPQLPTRRFDMAKLRTKDHPFFRKNAALLRGMDAGTP